MIWFKLSLEESTLDNSKELTQKVRELLETDEVLYTGRHEINENGIEAEDRFWEEYEEWEYDLLAEGTEEEPIKLSSHEIIVIEAGPDLMKIVQIEGDDRPVWYVRSA
jgi:hypothetical protein